MLEDQETLKRVADQDRSELVRRSAVAKITDPAFVKRFVHDMDWRMRMEIVRNRSFDDQETLAWLAENDGHHGVRHFAVDRLDAEHLRRLAESSERPSIREYAASKLRLAAA